LHRIAIVASLLVVPFVFAAENEPSTVALCRRLLDEIPRHIDAGRLEFSVPMGAVEALALLTHNPPPRAPFAAVLNEWQARLQVDPELSVATRLAVHVFDASPDRPVAVPVAAVGAPYAELRLNGELTNATIHGKAVVVLVDRPGDHLITASIAPAVRRDGDRRTIVLSRPNAAVATVAFQSRAAFEVTVDGVPGRIIGTRGTGTHGVLPARTGESVTVSWQPVRPHVSRRGTASVTPSIAWRVGERTLNANAILDIQILGGARETLGLSLPAGADRVAVTGPDLRDFRVAGNRLDIQFRGAVQGATRLRLAFEIPRPAGTTVTVPGLAVTGGRIVEGGWLLVSNDAGGQLLEREFHGYAVRTSLDPPPEVLGLAAQTPLFYLAQTARSATAVFDLLTTTPFPIADTIVDQAEVVAVVQQAGEEMVHLSLTVRNERRQFLRVRLPVGAQLLFLAVDNEPRRAARQADEMLVPLIKSVQTLDGMVSFPIDLVYLRRADRILPRTPRDLDLPELLDAPTAIINVTMYLPDEVTFESSTGPLRNVAQFADARQGLAYGIGYTTKPKRDAVVKREAAREDGEDKKKAEAKKKAAKKAKRAEHSARKKAERERKRAKQSARSAAAKARKEAEKAAKGKAREYHRTWTSTDDCGNASSCDHVAHRPAHGKASQQKAVTPEVPSFGAAEDEAVLNQRFADNAWRAGYKAYRENRLEDAKRYLEQAIELGEDSAAGRKAQQLLPNFDISAKSGKSTAKPGLKEKAQKAAISRTLQGGNVALGAEQSKLISKGMELVKSGKEREAAKVLEKAAQLSERLSVRGEQSKQAVLNADLLSTITDNKKVIRANTFLVSRLGELQEQAQDIVTTRDGSAFVEQLTNVTVSNNMDVGLMNSIVFDQRGVSAKSASQESVKVENRRLEQQITVLEEAIRQTEPIVTKLTSAPAKEAPAVGTNTKRYDIDGVLDDAGDFDGADDIWGTVDDPADFSTGQVEDFVQTLFADGWLTEWVDHGTFVGAAANINFFDLTATETPVLDDLDSDGDGMPDSWELQFFGTTTGGDPEGNADGDGHADWVTAPADAFPEPLALQGNGIDDDGDGVADDTAAVGSGAPESVLDGFDSDAGGFVDDVMIAKYLPGIDDSDGDLIGDGYEALYSGTETGLDASDDSDGDGISDLYEFLVNTNPFDDDSDADGVLVNGDGLSNAQEEAHGSDPRYVDTDGDGETDFDEVAAGSDPDNSAITSAGTQYRALSVDGTPGNYVALPQRLRFALDTYTIEAWVRPDAYLARTSALIEDTDGIPDTLEDDDGDGLNNLTEQEIGSDPVIKLAGLIDGVAGVQVDTSEWLAASANDFDSTITVDAGDITFLGAINERFSNTRGPVTQAASTIDSSGGVTVLGEVDFSSALAVDLREGLGVATSFDDLTLGTNGDLIFGSPPPQAIQQAERSAEINWQWAEPGTPLELPDAIDYSLAGAGGKFNERINIVDGVAFDDDAQQRIVFQGAHLDPAMIAEILERDARERIGAAADAVQGLRRRLAAMAEQATTLDLDIAPLRKEAEIQAVLFNSSYGNNSVLRPQLDDLQLLLQRSGQELEQARRQRQASAQVIVTGLESLEVSSLTSLWALADFVNRQMGGQAAQVSGGRLVSAQAERVHQLVQQLVAVNGQVVPCAARKLGITPRERRLVGRLFRSRTKSFGYTVLDEAGFLTLLESSNSQSDAARQVAIEGRQVRMNGARSFTVAPHDDSSNRIVFDGATITLPHDSYLVINGGREALVIRCGPVRGWREPDRVPVDVDVSAVHTPLFMPLVGIPVRFEKTYLAPGESPDMTMIFKF
jgi:hypothetical protein